MAEKLKTSTTRKRKNLVSSEISSKKPKSVIIEHDEEEIEKKHHVEVIEDEIGKFHNNSFDENLRKQLEDINNKLSAAELILQFNERLDNITLANNNYSNLTTNDRIIKKNSFLTTLFRSNSGNSSMRLIFFVWAVGTWVIWAAMSLYKNDLQPISVELAAILSALGAVKMGQTFGENRFFSSSNSSSSSSSSETEVTES